MEDRLAALARDVGPRPACEEGEREAGDLIREIFEARELSVEQQRVRSPKTYSYTYILYLALAIAVGVTARFAPGWAALGAAALSVAFFFELDMKPVLSRLVPKGISRNIVGRLHPSGHGSSKVVVISAHYDSARAALSFSPQALPRFRAMFLLTAASVWAVCLLAVVHWGAKALAAGWADVVWYATLVPAACLMFPIGILIHREAAMPWVDGANDNASGVVAMLEILERLAASRRRAAVRGHEAEAAPGVQAELGARGQEAALLRVLPQSGGPPSGGPPPGGEGGEGFAGVLPGEMTVGSSGPIGHGAEDWGDVAFTDWLGLDEEWDPRREGQRLGEYARIEEAEEGQEGEEARRAFDELAGELPDASTPVSQAPDLSFEGRPEGAAAAARVFSPASSGEGGLADKAVWFVATCCEEAGAFGMIDFLRRYGVRLRDAYFVNLDNLGAGRLAFTADEGLVRSRASDGRLVSLARQVADAKGFDIVAAPYHLLPTDATAALARGFRAISVMAFDERGLLPNWHWSTDTVERVQIENVETAADFVLELLRAL